jgi:chromosome segregation ATPase
VSWEDHAHHEIDSLEHDVYSLRSDIDDLRQRNSSLQYELHAADESFTVKLDEVSNELSVGLAEISRAVALLASRVEWLEGFVRQSGTADVFDLDEADAESKTLAATAERGQHVRSQQMSDPDRRYLESVVASHAEARRRRHEHRKEVLSLSAVLASTPITSPAHVEAAEKYEAAVGRLKTTTANVDRSVNAAKDAQAKIDKDDATRATAAPTIQAGDDAENQLFARLTRRLSDALDRGAMMPDWFTRDFGPTRPADGTEEWMDTAVGVLAFRITYDITDPIAALGIPPSEEQPQHKRDWRRDLNQRLARLRE